MSTAPKTVEAISSRTSEAPLKIPVENATKTAETPAASDIRPRRGGRRRLLMLSLPLAMAAAGGYLWITGGRYVATDNAYVHQPIVQISADVAGRVVEVNVTENQPVAAGTQIFRLDPEPYEIALEEAQATLAAARLQVVQLRAGYATAQAKLHAAESIREIKQREFQRQKSLKNRGIASAVALDEATTAGLSADNDVALAQDGVTAAAAALGGNPDIATDDFPSVRAALAQHDAAKRDLAHATVMAPVAGIVSQLDSLNVGQYVASGALVASLVQSDKTWIEANFKETQLAALKIGQSVTVEPDSFPGLKMTGTVESIGSATGSEFSLIPAQNATGNWVKVVQRVPVHIGITPDPAHPLRDGMSVNASVDTGASRLDQLLRLR